MIQILFYILIALFPLGVILKFSPLQSIQIAGQDIVVFFILILSLKRIVRALVNVKNSTGLLLAGFFIISIIGVVTHTQSLFQFTSSISYLLRLYAYLLLIIPLFALHKNTLKRLRMEMIISGFVFIVFGYVQYAFYPNLRNLYYLGWDEHLYRLFSTFFDPNFAGTFILLVLFLYVSFVMKKVKELNVKSKVLLLLPLALFIPALFLTYSRSAMLTGFIMTILFLVLIGYKKFIVVVIGVLLLILFLLPKNLGGEGVNLMRTASIFTRLQSNSQALVIFKDNPIIGVGFNTLRFTQDKYNFVLKSEVLTSHAAAGFPNSYLVILSTTGIVGSILFVLCMYIVLRSTLQKIKTGKKNSESFFLHIGFFVSICGILFNSLFENVLFYAPIMIWLVLLYGISIRMTNND